MIALGHRSYASLVVAVLMIATAVVTHNSLEAFICHARQSVAQKAATCREDDILTSAIAARAVLPR